MAEIGSNWARIGPSKSSQSLLIILLGFPGPSDGLRLHPTVFFSSGSGLTADSSLTSEEKEFQRMMIYWEQVEYEVSDDDDSDLESTARSVPKDYDLGDTGCNTPKLGRSGIRVRGMLLQDQ
ncbi:hypothetical protein Tco_0234199 [Tanacetum coccineum]